MPRYTQHQEITPSPLHTLHNCLYFIPFDKFRLQGYARFMIAFHSPDGVYQTGLLRCLAEKNAETPATARSGALSLVRFESKRRGIAPISRDFQSNPGRFLCTSDCVVALPGIEPGFED